ncbi:arrestin domain-containing protein 3-like [Hoplias malabaricus]|uniref:arrestin domain-containing protein 3-like n=1 Tax=Hoplias malabaricus TaxID=27720 RepID=UPI0034618444
MLNACIVDCSFISGSSPIYQEISFKGSGEYDCGVYFTIRGCGGASELRRNSTTLLTTHDSPRRFKMSTIKELTLTYRPVNERNTFTNGDLLQGRVILEVSKEVKIDCFYIKCKGDADVRWTEDNLNESKTYHSHERYFKLKQFFIRDPSKPAKVKPNDIITAGETYGNVVRPGRHVYSFSFQLPHRNMPPSFKGSHGSIKYILEVRLDRSWRLDHTAKAEINFVPRIDAGVSLMNPQSGNIGKKMKLFTSGSVSVQATIDRMGYFRGDVIRVSTNVDNSSSRELKLKYKLEQKQMFYVQGHSKNSSKTIFKVVGDPIPTGSKQTVKKALRIPPDLELTVATCSIIKLEYILKVYLDVPFASDPEIKFQVFILPAGQPGQRNKTKYGPSPPQAAFGPSSTPQAGFGPSPPSTSFGSALGLYPNLNPSPAYPSPTNPVAPPPSYTDVFPNQNQTVPGFQTASSAPPFNPPPYSAMGYPGPPAPEQHPAPRAPEFCPNPSAPGYGQAGGAPGHWPNSGNPTNQQEPYLTKTSEKHSY